MENSINKLYYKLFLTLIKYSPTMIVLLGIVCAILAYFGVVNFYISYVEGLSILLLFNLFMASLVFKFCYLYRLPLYLIMVVSVVAFYNGVVGIPLHNLFTIVEHLIFFGIFLLLFIKFKSGNAKHNKRIIS